MNASNIKTTNELVADIRQIISEVSKRQRRDFSYENYVLCAYCDYPNEHPRQIADFCNQMFGRAKNGEVSNRESVLNTLKKCKLSNVSERVELLASVSHAAQVVIDVIEGKPTVYSEVINIRNEMDAHVQKRRILLMRIVDKCAKLRGTPEYHDVMRLSKDFAGECMDAILDTILENYQPEQDSGETAELTTAEYKREINRLNVSLNRANQLLNRLQVSFEEQLAESIAEEQTRLISMLNSEKYGYILDLLLAAQTGFQSVKTRKIDIPHELKSMQTLVRRLREFVEDCDVTQTLDMGKRMEVRASDIEGYVFDGKPFMDENDVKTVEVVSPGWEIVNRDITISYPRVREITEV